MTKKFALMFALLLVPSFALAQDEVATVETVAAVQEDAVEETPPTPEPMAADSSATPMVGQGCVNCGQTVTPVVSTGCGCGGTIVSTPVSTGCGCGTTVAAPVYSGCGCGTPVSTPCGCSTPVSTGCGCGTPAVAPTCGTSCGGCGTTVAARPRLFRGRRSMRTSVASCGGCASTPVYSQPVYTPAPVSTGCGCGTASMVAPARSIVRAPRAFNVRTVSYSAPVTTSGCGCGQ